MKAGDPLRIPKAEEETEEGVRLSTPEGENLCRVPEGRGFLS